MNYYYHSDPESNPVLSQEESSHAIKVLRSKVGDELDVIDGKGTIYKCEITDANHRKCGFKVKAKSSIDKKSFSTHIAIAPTKNQDRLEWFVEKACELGCDEISIINTSRTERKKVNHERLEKKAIGAMKQSKNLWKCEVHELQSLKAFIEKHRSTSNKFVAFVETGKEDLLQKKIQSGADVLILIGPEGDFTHEEIELLKTSDFETVSLGPNVLRTETAGVIAAHTANLINQS